MPNYISSIRLPGTKDVIDLAYPISESTSSAVNVICGSNNSGKSYLLERTRQFLEKGTQTNRPTVTHHIKVTLTDPNAAPPACLFFGKSWLHKEQLKTIAYRRKNRRPFSSEILDFASAGLTILYYLVQHRIPQENQIDLTGWLANPDQRAKILGAFPLDEEKIYRGPNVDPLMREFERIVGGHLYFRRAQEGTADLVLAYGDGTTVHFEEWSDGQKNLLLIMALVRYAKPTVVLLDEIENHFHPNYISLVLNFLRREVPQSLVTTHHPHVIFSEFIDRVFYLEASRPDLPNEEAPEEWRHLKQPGQQAPTRKVHALTDAFGKVTAVYRLFHDQDRQLIRQAQQIRNDSDVIFHTAVTGIFCPDIVATKMSPLPDRQSAQLITALRDEFRDAVGNKVRVLEFGAGLGRIPGDISKLSPEQVGATVDWQCWEPIPAIRERLRDEVATKHIHATVLDSLDDAKGAFDICLLANVCHELTIQQFALVLSGAKQKLVPGRGVLLVQELFPLLSAEKFAVPYSADSMKRILTACGFAAHQLLFPVRDASAYCVVARPTGADLSLSPAAAAEAIDAEWKGIEQSAVDSYTSRAGITSYEGYSGTIQDLTTIASIAAWRSGRWKG